MSLKGKIQDRLTGFFLKMQNAEVKETIEYGYGGYDNEVYIYSSNSKKKAHANLWGTIVMPEFLFTEYSKVVQNYFFLHELGHLKFNLLIKIFVYILFMVTLLASLSGGVFLLILIITMLINVFPVSNFIVGFVYYSRYVILFGLVAMSISWLYELNADIFAVEIIGKESYLEVRDELHAKSGKVGLIEKIRYRFLYPPFRLLWYILTRKIP